MRLMIQIQQVSLFEALILISNGRVAEQGPKPEEDES